VNTIRDVVGLAGERTPEEVIQKALSTVRTHLGMEVAYLSEFVDDDAVFRAVDAPGLEALIKPGDSRPLDDVYCRHILAGRLPNVIPDTRAEPIAAALPITRETPIGSHVSVPIRRDDGSVYGMFCCLSPRPSTTLNARDLAVVEMFAELSAEQLNRAILQKTGHEAMLAAVRGVLDGRDFRVLLQPIADLHDARVSGFEALCRFRPEPYRSPDKWFADADAVGLLADLEIAVIDRALDTLAELPPEVYVSVNASPSTVASGRLSEAFGGRPLERIVLEVTEHIPVEAYDELVEETRMWRFRGVKLAIDDAGAGDSGLQHIVRLAPDILKLDMSLTRGIEANPAKRSLVAAMAHFAAETRSLIVAEGIETAAELDTLRALGVHRGQGWYLGRPAELADAAAFCATRDVA
jgi:EAL domain-containing protein (putative c-di-GMP-specific phosphodiesterase class I)